MGGVKEYGLKHTDAYRGTDGGGGIPRQKGNEQRVQKETGRQRYVAGKRVLGIRGQGFGPMDKIQGSQRQTCRLRYVGRHGEQRTEEGMNRTERQMEREKE